MFFSDGLLNSLEKCDVPRLLAEQAGSQGMWTAVSIRDSRPTFKMEIGVYIGMMYEPRALSRLGNLTRDPWKGPHNLAWGAFVSLRQAQGVRGESLFMGAVDIGALFRIVLGCTLDFAPLSS